MDTQDTQLAQVVELFTTLLGERQSQEHREPVVPSVPPGKLLDELPLGLPEQGLTFDEVADPATAPMVATEPEAMTFDEVAEPEPEPQPEPVLEVVEEPGDDGAAGGMDDPTGE